MIFKKKNDEYEFFGFKGLFEFPLEVRAQK
jgi:hypothetical protein